MEVSNFFARSHLSRLRLLNLRGNFYLSSWDFLAPRTTLLTALSLEISTFLPSPTLPTSQLFSFLASNPNIRELRLSNAALPNDADTSILKVQLRNLKTLSLRGKFRHLFGLLRRLILPEVLDDISLGMFDPTVEDISQTFGPYIRDHFLRTTGFQDNLQLFTSFSGGHISIGISHIQATVRERQVQWVQFAVTLTEQPPDIQERLLIDLIAPIPLERVASLDTSGSKKLPEELFRMMPNIETMRITGAKLTEGFLQPNPGGPYADTKLLPSLRLLCLYVVLQNDDDWGHLVTYLAHQTSDGQTISLEVMGEFPYDRPEVVNGIKGLVKEFTYYQNPRTKGG